MVWKPRIIAATVLVALATGPAVAQTTEVTDSVARGGVNSLEQRVGTLEGRPTLSGLVCSSGQIAKYNGVAWVCAADNDTDTDTSAATECGSGQVLTGDGTCVSLPSGSGQGRFQFAGDTELPSGASARLDGATGQHSMSVVCHNYIPGSRMCTTEEILTTTFESGQSGLSGKTSGWVHPSIVGVNILAAGSSADIVATDYSGLIGHPSSELSCDGWSSNSPDKFGLFASSAPINIEMASCDQTLKVTCCKPFP